MSPHREPQSGHDEDNGTRTSPPEDVQAGSGQQAMRRLDALERMVLRQQESLDQHASLIHRLRLELHVLKRKGGDDDERWPATDAYR